MAASDDPALIRRGFLGRRRGRSRPFVADRALGCSLVRCVGRLRGRRGRRLVTSRQGLERRHVEQTPIARGERQRGRIRLVAGRAHFDLHLARIGRDGDRVQIRFDGLLSATHDQPGRARVGGHHDREVRQVRLELVRALPGNPAGSLVLQPIAAADDLELEVFAGGKVARLKPQTGAPVFEFISNLPDGPRGRIGTTKLAFDAWYRQNGQGVWELDALFPRLAPGTWTQFEQEPYALEDLFRLSNF